MNITRRGFTAGTVAATSALPLGAALGASSDARGGEGGPSFADWLEITALKARYCRLLDTKDWEGFAALFTPDAVMDVATPTGFGRIEGRDAFMARVRQALETAKTAHHVHQPEVTLQGDTAHVIWAMQDRVVWEQPKRSITGYGHYEERYVRTQAGWRIASTRLTRLYVDEHSTDPEP